MIYVIHRKHVFDGGSRKSWNAVTAYDEVYRTGILNIAWSKDFHYKKEAVAWCRKHGFPYMTEKDWDKIWDDALFEAGDVDDIWTVASEILNKRYFNDGVREMPTDN